MNIKSTNDINSGAEFANELQFLGKEQRTEIYSLIRDRLSDFIQSSNDFANVLQYLSPSQQTAVFETMKPNLLDLIHTDADRIFILRYLPAEEAKTFKNILTFIDRMNASEPAKQFASALLEDDDRKMKSHFDTLIQQSQQPTIKHISYFEKQSHHAQLMDATAHLGPHWISKISDALGLNLNEEGNSSQKDMVEAIKSYLPTIQPPRAMN